MFSKLFRFAKIFSKVNGLLSTRGIFMFVELSCVSTNIEFIIDTTIPSLAFSLVKIYSFEKSIVKHTS